MSQRGLATVCAGRIAAILLVCALATPVVAAPQYLRSAPDPVTDSPFEAALRGESPPRRSNGGRFLLRPEPARFASAAEAGRLEPTDGVVQVQYPLVDAPAASPPDEPLTDASDAGHSRGLAGWVGIGSVRADVTSVLGSGDTLGITTIGLRAVFESPRLPGFSLRPILGLHAVGGPLTTDLPGQLYDVSLEARMYWPFGDRWLGEFAVAPGIFSDFRNTSEAVRIVGRGIGYYKCSETLRLAVGVAYLDRQDIAVLPVGGLIWTPSEDWRYELMLPRPRIAWRCACAGHRERWCYLLGEFGGGSWAIERAGGIEDIATYRDYRLMLGLEVKHTDGVTWLLEAGYAFGRQLEYQTGVGDYEPDATGVVRAALTF